MFNTKQAAQKAGIGEGLLILWLSTGRFKPAHTASLKSTDFPKDDIAARVLAAYAGPGEQALGLERFYFEAGDVDRLRKLVEQTADKRVKAEDAHTKGAHYSVQELASLWSLGTDKIRELFENEPGVIKLQNPPKKGKRIYTTLRIPENVAARVERRIS